MVECIIKPTKSTPEIILNPEGTIIIRGWSIPEDPVQFFNPMEDWVSAYIVFPAELTCVDIKLEVINADTCKHLIHILQKLTYVSLKKKKLCVNWYYEEDDNNMLEIGENFASTLDVLFNFIKINIEHKNSTLVSNNKQIESEIIALEKHPNYQKHLDELTKLSSKKSEVEESTEQQSIEPQIKEQTMTEKQLTKHKSLSFKGIFKTLTTILAILIFAGATIFLLYLSNQRYKGFYGNWEIKPPQGGRDIFIIKNVSIYSSKNLTLIYVKGDIQDIVWGPLLFVAKHKGGNLEVEPCKFYLFNNPNPILTNILTQPFKIYYSSEYDRIILGNTFFVRSKEAVWNY